MDDQLQEIVEHMPGGVLRWALPVLAVIMGLLLLVSALVAYPDVASGRFTLTTSTPPARLVARVSAQIDQIFVRDGERTRRGAPLLVLGSATAYADVEALRAWLGALDRGLGEGRGGLPGAAGMSALGELQDEYAALAARVSDYNSLQAEQGFGAAKSSALRGELRDHEQLDVSLREQQALLEADVRLAAAERTRARELADQRLIAAADAERAEQAYLQKRLAAENGRVAIGRSRVDHSRQRSAMLDFERGQLEERRRREMELRSAIEQVRGALAAWEAEHLLRAPISGSVSMFRALDEAQHVNAMEPVLAVLPDSRELRVRVHLEQRGAGKVRPGQRVILRFDSYPHREYGTVSGVVERVSPLGKEGEEGKLTYLVEVALPRGLRTTYGRTLEFRQELLGDADVVTADRRLISRLFDQLRPAPAR
jgi:multidrug resistance efflux pump